MKVHEIMTAHPHSVGPANTLVEAAGLMRELDVGALPVFDDDELTGLVTDRDLVVRGVADGRDPNTATVAEVMSGGVEYIFADQEVEEAAHVMESRQIRRLPVMDRDRRLVGMISLGDLATSSNPAFSGTALRDVSQPNGASARRKRLARQSEPARMPTVPGTRQGPSRGKRGANARKSSRSRSQRRSSPQSQGSGSRGAQQSRGRGRRGARRSGRNSRR